MANTPYVTTSDPAFAVPGPNTLGTASAATAITGLITVGVASDTVGFYGKTPIAKRAGAAQGTSLVGTASSTAVNSDLKAAVIEIMNTLAAVGLWKGSA